MNNTAQAIQLPNRWVAREHQREFMNWMFKNGQFPTRKRAMPVWHRRAGKDSCALNTLAVASQMRIGTYWHLLPTLNQGRKVVWNGVDGGGRRMIYQGFPREMINGVNESDMLLKLRNDSVYQVVGSDNYDALVGTNPLGVVFSEWALADPRAWSFIRPILAENAGFAIFITTPRGKNHAYTMYKMAKDSPDWFTSLKTIRETHREDGSPIISEEIVESERAEGVPEEVIQQEYYCSWEGVNHGSIYGRQLLLLAETNQIEMEPDLDIMVFTAWDIGRRDATAIWFYQLIRDEIHIIDYDEGTGGDVDFWLERLREFPYLLGTPALPHDAKARTFATKYSPHERFVQAKFSPYIVPNVSVSQGINAVRAILPDVYFNIANPRVCKGLEHLQEYMYDYDEKLKTFALTPRHDHHSHGADAFRMLALSQNVIEIISRKTRNRAARKGDYIQTPLGRALNLENLFKDREARNMYRRV
jgi:hypothetical protein